MDMACWIACLSIASSLGATRDVCGSCAIDKLCVRHDREDLAESSALMEEWKDAKSAETKVSLVRRAASANSTHENVPSRRAARFLCAALEDPNRDVRLAALSELDADHHPATTLDGLSAHVQRCITLAERIGKLPDPPRMPTLEELQEKYKRDGARIKKELLAGAERQIAYLEEVQSTMRAPEELRTTFQRLAVIGGTAAQSATLRGLASVSRSPQRHRLVGCLQHLIAFRSCQAFEAVIALLRDSKLHVDEVSAFQSDPDRTMGIWEVEVHRALLAAVEQARLQPPDVSVHRRLGEAWSEWLAAEGRNLPNE